MKKYLPWIVAVAALAGVYLQWRNQERKKCTCDEETTSTANKIS